MDKKYKELQLKLKRVEHELEEAKLTNEKLKQDFKKLDRMHRNNTNEILDECRVLLNKKMDELMTFVSVNYNSYKSITMQPYKPKYNSNTEHFSDDEEDDEEDEDDEEENRVVTLDANHLKRFLNGK